MFITKEFVIKINDKDNKNHCQICPNGYIWFAKNFPKGAEHEEIFKLATSKDEYINYCTWALANSMTKEQNAEWSIWCAEKVLPVFENEYPYKHNPREAIEKAKVWLKNPIENVETLNEINSSLNCLAQFIGDEASNSAWKNKFESIRKYSAADAIYAVCSVIIIFEAMLIIKTEKTEEKELSEEDRLSLEYFAEHNKDSEDSEDIKLKNKTIIFHSAWTARVSARSNPALSMQILQKGFEIWRTK